MRYPTCKTNVDKYTTEKILVKILYKKEIKLATKNCFINMKLML